MKYQLTFYALAIVCQDECWFKVIILKVLATRIVWVETSIATFQKDCFRYVVMTTESEEVDCKALLKLVTSLQTLTASQQQVNINKFVSYCFYFVLWYKIFDIFSCQKCWIVPQYSLFQLITQNQTIFTFRFRNRNT